MEDVNPALISSGNWLIMQVGLNAIYMEYPILIQMGKIICPIAIYS